VCIVGQLDANGNAIRPVDGVRLSNLSVTGFARPGQTGENHGQRRLPLGRPQHDHRPRRRRGQRRSRVHQHRHERRSIPRRHRDNNGFAGIQVAESSGPGHKLQDVVVYANRYGLFVLGACGGVVDSNLHDNCLGALFFGHHTSHWEVIRTSLHNNNNRVCPALAERDPASSGGGVAVIGADDGPRATPPDCLRCVWSSSLRTPLVRRFAAVWCRF
jgi:hypothetical protein